MTPDPVVTSPAVTAWAADQLAEKRGVHHPATVDQQETAPITDETYFTLGGGD
jgi:hypothetical protein